MGTRGRTTRRWTASIRHSSRPLGAGPALVAEGAAFSDGGAVIRWLTGTRSTVVWDDVEDVHKVHGHGGATRIVWVDPPGDTLVSLSHE
jgi:hypothetical protein